MQQQAQSAKWMTDDALREFLGDWWVDELDFDETEADMLAAANALLEKHYVTLRVDACKGFGEGVYEWSVLGLREE